ncbi:MAG: hypothetical protein ACOKSU_14535 [Pseudomonas sp.]|uniref:hypothetical protein n=1 Tax=Pseudomonas TaxID=286 RepID=UPI0003C0B103|nr:hypothetical protein [Pseudomonas sp. VLB120]AGZ36363.1 hypothetical protein PVLB_17910 [Pseudomonas sp. VLB120]
MNDLTNQRAYEDLFQIERMPTSCLLCQTGELEKLGHVIPKFVMRWLKEASKFKSFYFNNDQTVFDTPAFRMMCNTCEAKFSTLEKYFTDNIFKKYYRKKSPNPIQDDVYNFAISIAWRLIVFSERLKSTEPQQQAFESTYSLSEKLMRDYLNGKIKSCEHSVYALPIEHLTKHIPEDQIDEDALKYSIKQGLKAHPFNDEKEKIGLSLLRIPTIHFKLGCYYFFIFPDNYFAGAEFTITSTKVSNSKQLHLLDYTPELLGFMDWLMDGRLFEVNIKDLPPTSYTHRNARTLWDLTFGSKRGQRPPE